MAADSSSTCHERENIWGRVHSKLLRHAVPDSRFDYDFSSFVPDFRGSSSAIDRIVELACYKSANTILITSDNSLEQLRHRALRDEKRVLVGTHKLRRGFVLLDPKMISEDKHEKASWLDGMERPGIGRPVTLTQLEEKVDLCVTGVLAVSGQGDVIKRSPQYFEIQWGMLLDMNVLDRNTPVIAVAHSCQVVNEEGTGVERIRTDGQWNITPDYVVTPEKALKLQGVERPGVGIQFDTLDSELLVTIPSLQELKGIQMMEQIMKGANFAQETSKPSPSVPNVDEQLGISMVERIMKGYKV
ncbi:hypothetical protein K505DRAFT_328855 [Melanomma pulvis-pyrius CBS 109.77]|uniref:5-formyltetrahydrofolate cyclo-ligase n=1 Tax=Melanomma pulvis-pyrius CBS 109.77 TaxID=1314802 RepID=A0A6A6WXD5_9PLEO|nr:hypothetical protein K505DRAFT_328855 [Melanomma pulvis-pyrius CBS 109.77]